MDANTTYVKNYYTNVGTPFYETLKLFQSFTGLRANRPLDYDDWMNLPTSHKSAALFVMFYNEVTFAYYKAKSMYSPEEDNVSIVCQYLEKNVSIIENDENRYSPKYIYQVCYNCIFCQSRGIKRDLDRFENEIPAVFNTDQDGRDIYLWDDVQHEDNTESEYFKQEFWKSIYELGQETLDVVENILNGTRLPAGVKKLRPDIEKKLRIVLQSFIDVDLYNR